MRVFGRVFFCVMLAVVSLPAQALRDDVLVIVNDNSVDSPQLGAYYAQQRGIDSANIVHVRVPDSYFISWDDFRRLRDQLIRFMQLNTLDDPALQPVVCADGEPPYYCQAALDQLRTHTRIRYLVTTRGVPTRMTVTGSTLLFPNAPTSVDNYLKYWLLNYFATDTRLRFTEREQAFGDGRGIRTVEPATDRELIVGRIDGLDLNAARALVDRALAAERQGLYGRLFGSTKFNRWVNHSTLKLIYPPAGIVGWPYQLGLFGEAHPECTDYLDFSGTLPEGKAPAHCQVQLNDDVEPFSRTNYPAPGNPSSRQAQAVDALLYQGWLDGQRAAGSFNALLNWRKDDRCTVTLCDNAADPAACRANSTDVFGELNTDCVGVADGFMGYNHQSFPVSYLAVWPTGWSGPRGGDQDRLAFPEVRTDLGFDDSFSLWFRNTDQVANPRCYLTSDFSLPAATPCPDARQMQLSQTIQLGNIPFDPNNPPTYQISLQYQGHNISQVTPLRVRLLAHETGAGATLIDYGLRTLATVATGDTNWTPATVQFPLDPLRQTGASYDRITLVFDTAVSFSGALGVDTVSVQAVGQGAELAINGSFTAGHRQVTTGDHAATFLNRLNGVAFWGSVGHHQSAGCAFCTNGLEPLVYFLRGLPLGDAIWFNESNNSGILYGDPLYSPVAVRLNPVNATDTLSGVVDLYGSAVNGRDPAMVTTTYRIDACPGDDFFACDQAQSWQATGLSGQGGAENALLGSLDTTMLAPGTYTLRLGVTSVNTTSGRSQTLNDYYPVEIQSISPPIDPAPETPPVGSTPETPSSIGVPGNLVNLSGTVQDAGGTNICAMVLASGQSTFSCNPLGEFLLTDLPRENDGTVKRQIYAAGFLPKLDVLPDSVSETVVMTRTGTCPSYNMPYDPGTFPGSAGKRINISGQVLMQNSQTPICALVLANGQQLFSCDGTGSYALDIPLDTNGQFKLQVYADGYAPAIQTFDEFQATNDVRMTRATECQ